MRSLAVNQSGLSSELLAFLAQDLKDLTGGEQELAERLTVYAASGEDEAVLAELPALLPQPTAALTYSFYHPRHSRFLAQVSAADAQLFYRLARVYSEMAVCRGLTARQNPRIALDAGTDFYPFLMALAKSRDNARDTFPVSTLEAVFQLAGHDAGAVARATYLADPNDYWARSYSGSLSSFGGFDDYSVGHRQVVLEALTHPRSEQRLHAMELLKERGVPPEPFCDVLVALACSSSKLARAAASALLEGCPAEAAQLLEKKAVEAGSEERFHAVKLLRELAGEDASAFLNSRLEAEKAPKVRELIQRLLAPNLADECTTESGVELPTFPPVVVESEAPLSAEFFKEFRQALDEYNGVMRAHYEKYKDKNPWLKEPPSLPPEAAEQFFSLLQRGNARECHNHPYKLNYIDNVASGLTARLFAHPEFKLIHAVRWVSMVTSGQFIWHISGQMHHLERPGSPRPDLRTLAAVMRTLGMGESEIINILFNHRYAQPLKPFMARDEDVWPYLAENMSVLREALGDDAKSGSRTVALALLQTFPRVPLRLIERVWGLALGPSKTDRPAAQLCLEKEPHRFERIVKALGDRDAGVRTVAADWLARLGEERAVEPLRKAFGKEKSETVKDALLRALEKLGASTDEYFDRSKLEDEARAGLARAGASAPAWLAFDLMPSVAWADTGEAVGADVLKWFVVQSLRQKQVEPSPMLRRFCSMFERTGRERLGQFVLESWVAQDTLCHTPEEVEPLARKQAAANIRYYAQSGKTEEQLYREILNGLLRQCKGSAINEKGMLALAAACCGAAAVPVVAHYLKEWHGTRAAQSKALVRLLAEVDDPAATQTLLAVANRFRTRGIQEEAAKHVQLLAERKGWTLDELADRTVPTLGFEPNGELQFDYGARRFKASLDSKFNFVLADETGKKLKSLPDARKDADAEKVKEAKKLFADAKKGLKQLLALQRDRLYEAMCTQREWTFRDWDTFLNRHPVVGRYCQSLVWVVCDGGEAGLSFRPLSDGTLTDARDEEVALTPDTRLRLAHSRTLPKEQAEAWLAHFADYEVAPLFEQFGREDYVLADERRRETEIKDFEGHLIETFKLRGRATALGYTRGQAEDAGWFYLYKKTFPGLRLEAFIEFTGNGLPEENRTVALKSLSFSAMGEQPGGYYSSASSLPLWRVPPVLLSEVWNDMRSVAAQGTGYDPDWEKKSEY
jgi:HEAT repeat protein